MKTMTKVFVAIAAVGLVACSGSKKNYANLTAHEWILDKVEHVDSASQIVIPQERELRMAFADSTQAVYGMAPCNGFFGPFTVDGDNMTIGSLATTMAYCPDMPFESAYLAWLKDVATYKATENTLTLRDANNKVTLYYIKKQ